MSWGGYLLTSERRRPGLCVIVEYRAGDFIARPDSFSGVKKRQEPRRCTMVDLSPHIFLLEDYKESLHSRDSQSLQFFTSPQPPACWLPRTSKLSCQARTISKMIRKSSSITRELSRPSARISHNAFLAVWLVFLASSIMLIVFTKWEHLPHIQHTSYHIHDVGSVLPSGHSMPEPNSSTLVSGWSLFDVTAAIRAIFTWKPVPK